MLTELATQPASYAAASTRLAALDAAENNRAEAQLRIKEVLTKYPRDVPAQLLNANLLYLDHKNDEALAAVNAAIAIDPNSGTAHLMAGRFYAASDRADDAIKSYEQALKLDPRSIEAALALARLNLLKGAMDRSLTYTQQVLTAQPDNPDARNLLVRSYVHPGRCVEGARSSRQPEEGLSQLADGLRPRGADESGRKAARRGASGVRQSPGVEAGRRRGLNGTLASGYRSRAAPGCDGESGRRPRQGAKQPWSVDSGGAHGGHRRRSGQERSAAPARARGRSIEPSVLQPPRPVVRAAEAHQRGEGQVPGGAPARPEVGRGEHDAGACCWEAEGNTVEAVKEYQHTLSIDPRAAVAANNLAYIYVSADKQLDEALQLAQTAVQAMPDEPIVNDTLGWIYVRKNQATLGIPHLELCVQKQPDEPVFNYHLGMAYLQTGEFDKAKKALTKALSIRPDFEGAEQARKALATIGA